ncbi:MAG TPA: heme-binding protein [Bryobacteraceae bacterium]|nr:heme-binding protein [Bryobacteraceae bacterium]
MLALTCAIADIHAQNGPSFGNGNASCSGLPGHSALTAALATALSNENSGLNNQMWATVVDRDGIVCAVAFSGANRGAQWPGSRVIAAQKANTANSFSLDSSSRSNGKGQMNGLALSTANLFTAVQPGGSLFGLQESNPVVTDVAYRGPSSNYGQSNDPMVGSKIGGVNVFGGGLGLYASGKVLVGGIGVSGDTSCTDHDIAWRMRRALGLDHLAGVGGVSGDPARPDNIIYDIGLNPDGTGGTGQGPAGSGGVGMSPSGFGHPKCLNSVAANTLPAVQ